MTAADFARALGGRRSGSCWMARCPAHHDRTPSLSIIERGGKLLVHCHAGCSQGAVIEALRARRLWPKRDERLNPPARPGAPTKPQREREALGPSIAEYIYTDEAGTPLYRVTRHEPKTFRQWRPDGNGGWLPGLRSNTRMVPYRLRELLENPIVFVVEGEKDVETLREHGFVATSNVGGAGKWAKQFREWGWARYFRGRTVIVIPDTDPVGRLHGTQVIRTLKPVAAQVILVDLRPDDVKDITEWFQNGHSEFELVELLGTAWHEEELSNGRSD